MSGLFGSSTPPPPPPPTPPPAPPSMDVAQQTRMQADELRRRQGRAATILTQPQGMLADGQRPMTATKRLTGE
jgi:hypothetical protein